MRRLIRATRVAVLAAVGALACVAAQPLDGETLPQTYSWTTYSGMFPLPSRVVTLDVQNRFTGAWEPFQELTAAAQATIIDKTGKQYFPWGELVQVPQGERPFPSAGYSTLELYWKQVGAFGVMALGLAVLSFVIPGQMQRTACAQASLQVTEQADPNASSVIPYRDAPKRRVFADAEQAYRAAFVAYRPAMILGCSLCETVALSGFVIAFMGHPLPLALPFFALSWLLFALRFPTLARVRGPLEKAKGAVFPGPT